MIVVGGSASQGLSRAVACLPDFSLANMVTKRFPDTEYYVKINDDLKGEDVVIIQTTYPDPNIMLRG